MTVSEMHISFKLGLDKVDSLSYPNFLDEEIDLFLNQGYQRLINQKLGRNNIRQKGFEEIQLRTDELSGLVKPAVINNPSRTGKVYTIPLPSDYMYLINYDVFYVAGNCSGTSQNPRQVQHDDLKFTLTDPFEGPFKDQPILVLEGNSILIYTDGTYIIPEVDLTYVKFPLTLDITATGINSPTGKTNIPEVSKSIHREIVDYAIMSAIETIESDRVKTFPQQLSMNE